MEYSKSNKTFSKTWEVGWSTINIPLSYKFALDEFNYNYNGHIYTMDENGYIDVPYGEDLFHCLSRPMKAEGGKILESKTPARCSWANPKNPRYLDYHDNEWGKPVYDDHHLFEMLILEGFQAGLSWECVLNKRESFREAFDDFDLDKVCNYGEEKILELMQNEAIIRNRRKCEAAIVNARIFIEIQREYGSFSEYLWGYTNHQIIYENDKTSSKLSDAISKDLKKRGMKFVGTTILYSFLQAVGVINSHEDGCYLCSSTNFLSMD